VIECGLPDECHVEKKHQKTMISEAKRAKGDSQAELLSKVTG